MRALRPRWSELAKWPARVLALQEVKLSRRRQPLLTADFRTEGWASTWGLPQPLIESEFLNWGTQRHTKRSQWTIFAQLFTWHLCGVTQVLQVMQHPGESAHYFAIVLATNRLRTSLTTIPRTPPSSFFNAVKRPIRMV